MKIKKIGHCCLLINVNNLTILTDPGSYSTEQNSIKGIDIVLITHEHGDHLHVGSVQEILKNNPSAKVITNSGVGKKLAEVNIPYTVLEGTAKMDVAGVALEAFDCKHGEIFEEMGQVQNTAYFIDGKLFYPGDSFYNPQRPVDVLALPVAGTWCKMPDALRYAIAVNPKKAFPVHEAMILPNLVAMFHKTPEKVLGDRGIQFISMLAGDEREF